MPTVSLRSAVKKTIGEIEDRVSKGGVDCIGIPTGFHKLDEILSGLRKDSVYVIGARTSMGKTALAATIGMNVAQQGHKVLFLSLEMSANLLSLRMISGMTQIPAERIELGKITKDELNKVQGTLGNFDQLTFVIKDDTTSSEEFVAYAKEYQQKHGLDLLIIDYLSLFRDTMGSNDVERVGRISNNIRTIARDCDIPVISLVQLNREVEKREDHMPLLSDIRSSGDVEQDAFAVLLVVRPHYYAMMHNGEEELLREDALIIIAKNRQGRTGRTRATFYPTQMRWEQLPPVLTEPKSLKEKVQNKRA